MAAAVRTHSVTNEDGEQALAHLALRGTDSAVIMSKDRKSSMVRDGDPQSPRWSFYRSFEASPDGFDSMLEFINWCGARGITVQRNHTQRIDRVYGIIGWLEKPGAAEEFRIAWI